MTLQCFNYQYTFLRTKSTHDDKIKVFLLSSPVPEPQPQPSQIQFKDQISSKGTGADTKMLWATTQPHHVQVES